MDVDRELIVEAVGATLPVLALIGAFVVIGTQYAAPDGGLTETGGQAMVGSFVLFVFMMLAIGLALSRRGGPGGSSADGA